MKAKTKVKKVWGEWTVTLTIGVQTFTLCLHERTREEAKWFKKNLDTALANLTKTIHRR